MRRHRVTRVCLVVTLTLLGACGGGDDAGSVSLAYYMRNLSDQPFEYEITSSDGEYGRGRVTPEPASIGCGRVPRDWELRVWPARDDGRVGDPVAHLSAIQVGAVDPVVVWVSVNPAGQVQTGLGLPAWWHADIQRCP